MRLGPRAGLRVDIDRRIDDGRVRERREAPRDDLDRDIRDRQAVDAPVLGVERRRDGFVADRELLAFADPQCDLVALTGVARVDAVAERHRRHGHTRGHEHSAPFGPQLVEQPIAFVRLDDAQHPYHRTGEVDANG